MDAPKSGAGGTFSVISVVGTSSSKHPKVKGGRLGSQRLRKIRIYRSWTLAPQSLGHPESASPRSKPGLGPRRTRGVPGARQEDRGGAAAKTPDPSHCGREIICSFKKMAVPLLWCIYSSCSEADNNLFYCENQTICGKKNWRSLRVYHTGCKVWQSRHAASSEGESEQTLTQAREGVD